MLADDVYQAIELLIKQLRKMLEESKASSAGDDDMADLMLDDVAVALHEVQELVDLAKAIPAVEPFSLHELTQETLQLFRSKAKAKQVLLDNSVSKAFQVTGQARLLKIFLCNTIGNALKHMGTKSVEVEAKVAAIIIDAQEKDGLLTLSVGDNGVGMDEATRLKLLDHRNVVGKASHLRGNSGVGLQTCQEVAVSLQVDCSAENEGFTVDSKVGYGSTFSVRFPAKLPPSDMLQRYCENKIQLYHDIRNALSGLVLEAQTRKEFDQIKQACELLTSLITDLLDYNLLMLDKLVVLQENVAAKDLFAVESEAFVNIDAARFAQLLDFYGVRQASIVDQASDSQLSFFFAFPAATQMRTFEHMKHVQLIKVKTMLGKAFGDGFDDLAEIFARVNLEFCQHLQRRLACDFHISDEGILLSLPVARAEAQVSSPVVSPLSQSNHRILVAEDNTVNRMLLIRLLVKMGYKDDGKQIVPAVNGRLAWEAFLNNAESPFTHVLTDEQMPEMGGLELCERIRAQTEIPCPIITLVSANVHSEYKNEGFDNFLQKPVQASVLAGFFPQQLAISESSPEQASHDDAASAPPPVLNVPTGKKLLNSSTAALVAQQFKTWSINGSEGNDPVTSGLLATRGNRFNC